MKLLPDIAFLASAATILTTHAAAAAAAAQPVKADPETQYKHFVAHHESHTCSADAHATPFNNQIRGVNLGGWMVLEPWITPSLFYQFLGKDETTTGLDMHSFCEVLGPIEGNKQLQRHWKTWVTEEIIQKLAQSGAVNSLRLPVGDWMYKPYGPYIGCTDGALDHVDYVLDWAHENGLTILFDIHGVKGSQNGFDNSGQSQGFEWTSLLVSLFVLLSSSVQSFIHHFEDLTSKYSLFLFRILSQQMMFLLNIGQSDPLVGWETLITSLPITPILTMTISNMHWM